MAHPIIDSKLDASMPATLLSRQHAAFLAAYEKKDDCTLDYLKLSGIFWTLTALDLIGELDLIDRDKVVDLVLSCQQPDGGLSPAPGHDSHLLSTLSGIQILALFDCVHKLNCNAMVRFILKLQQSDGSFCGDEWGEIDTRFTFCALASLSLLGRLDECVQSGHLNAEECASYLERCQNLDGGFGTQPGSESHAGQAYCVLGALSLLHGLRRLNLERAAWWLAERQLPSGGLNGRPEKKPDVCYSWWALASLTILGRLTWIDDRKLTRFILASQDPETGGIADRPGDMPDPFHTLFGLAGLSLIAQAGREAQALTSGLTNGSADETESQDIIEAALLEVKVRLKPINPVFCMPQYIIDRMHLNVQLIQ
ncbi:Rab geranylgeranyltransferase beta subunit [Fasciolopsis buskii]|uniref:Geranylgeranyl transferase type-2 subunit beta n=1 Tax=Fasciolopsis buskii TaxID=27845 RepID=A0A8E0S7K4_9TREM|nr:Rab geranylgeranyltransferase beta subunit [Fasciolopsis buski]